MKTNTENLMREYLNANMTAVYSRQNTDFVRKHLLDDVTSINLNTNADSYGFVLEPDVRKLFMERLLDICFEIAKIHQKKSMYALDKVKNALKSDSKEFDIING